MCMERYRDVWQGRAALVVADSEPELGLQLALCLRQVGYRVAYAAPAQQAEAAEQEGLAFSAYEPTGPVPSLAEAVLEEVRFMYRGLDLLLCVGEQPSMLLAAKALKAAPKRFISLLAQGADAPAYAHRVYASAHCEAELLALVRYLASPEAGALKPAAWVLERSGP